MRREQTTTTIARGRRLSMRVPRIALLIALTTAQAAAQGGLELTEEDLGHEVVNLRAALAGADEEAYAQVLTLVDVVQDPEAPPPPPPPPPPPTASATLASAHTRWTSKTSSFNGGAA